MNKWSCLLMYPLAFELMGGNEPSRINNPFELSKKV